MICPLLLSGFLSNGDKTEYAPDIYECRKNGCVWWDDFEKDCCVCTVKGALIDLSVDFERIIDKTRGA